MMRPSSFWSRSKRRQLAAGLVLVSYLFAALGVPVTLAAPEQAAAALPEKQNAHPCGCAPQATCCCTPQPSACSLPCCAPAKETPRAPGLALSPTSCRCTTSNLWISVGSVLPVPPAVAGWQPYFSPCEWLPNVDSALIVISQLPDVPPPRATI